MDKAAARAIVKHLSAEERAAVGRAARATAPRAALAEHAPSARRDPVAILVDQAASRQQDLLPIRYGRMAASPFAFLRGAAAVMAADFAASPVSGLRVQAIGDAHISNFGVFASPDRRLVFDINDFDETLPGPWEWDVKRLVASVVVAAGENGADEAAAAAAAQRAAAAYRVSMRRFADDATLDVWYAHLDVEDIAASSARPKDRARLDKMVSKIRSRTSRQVVGKLAEVVDGELLFRSLPPLVTPLHELVGSAADAEAVREAVTTGFAAYRASLAPERRLLLDRFRIVDIARKVVGVGSVGTRCFIVLLVGRDTDDPLVLQFKEADRSVLEPYAGRSVYRHRGARVVNGQRLVQLESDLFLGWSSLPDDQHFYWRQLKDMKASAEIGMLGAKAFTQYVDACSWCLANAHARSGDPIAIAAYLGAGTSFDKAIAAFATAYAVQTTADWEALKQAIADGMLEAQAGV